MGKPAPETELHLGENLPGERLVLHPVFIPPRQDRRSFTQRNLFPE